MELHTEEALGIIGSIIVVGGVIVALLKGVFMTKRECKDTQSECNTKICGKIDKLAKNHKESETKIFQAVDHNRDIVMDKFLEIQQSMGRIEGKLSNLK